MKEDVYNVGIAPSRTSVDYIIEEMRSDFSGKYIGTNEYVIGFMVKYVPRRILRGINTKRKTYIMNWPYMYEKHVRSETGYHLCDSEKLMEYGRTLIYHMDYGAHEMLEAISGISRKPQASSDELSMYGFLDPSIIYDPAQVMIDNIPVVLTREAFERYLPNIEEGSFLNAGASMTWEILKPLVDMMNTHEKIIAKDLPIAFWAAYVPFIHKYIPRDLLVFDDFMRASFVGAKGKMDLDDAVRRMAYHVDYCSNDIKIHKNKVSYNSNNRDHEKILTTFIIAVCRININNVYMDDIEHELYHA